MHDNLTIQTTWTDKDWAAFTTWVKGVLTTTPQVTITFTKKDGSERVMKCTLMPEKLPPVTVTENKTERKKSEDTLAVYDLESNGWRSFVIKSVKKINFDL